MPSKLKKPRQLAWAASWTAGLCSQQSHVGDKGAVGPWRQRHSPFGTLRFFPSLSLVGSDQYLALIKITMVNVLLSWFYK